ncbi:MAG: hypothetical protein JNN30_05735 [Rhodanobacteraceae bacterium]|nr:hypothetical protein [Rhodanobacteraceae bacterium]
MTKPAALFVSRMSSPPGKFECLTSLGLPDILYAPGLGARAATRENPRVAPMRLTEDHTMCRALIRSAACALLGVLTLAGTAFGDSAKSRLEQLMGPKFREAGLERATPAEIAVLEQFMIEHAGELRALTPASDTASAAAVVAADPARAERAEKKSEPADNRVSSRIAGVFKGWSSGTTLTLENGQRWRVTDGSSLVTRPLDSPAVTVQPGTFGSWWLRVEGYNSAARVKPAN